MKMINIIKTSFPSIFIPFAYLLCNIHSVGAAGRTVSDWRIQSHDITPVLGRGYSVATGSLQSTCLNVEEQTKPSYDYDYFFTEITDDRESAYTSAWSSKIKTTFSYWWVKGQVERSYKSNYESNTKMKKHFVIATMRTERYYSSVDEVHSELSDAAQSLLESGQYISFFQACGPNYIRSIRRAAEITAIFSYSSTETSSNSNFESDLKYDIKGVYYRNRKTNYDRSYSRKVENNSLRTSLTIDIKAFGLALNEEGASSLVARSMDDFQKVMDFAFQSMHTIGVGMVQGIEIVPWVDNPQFQVAAGLADVVQDCGEDDKDEEDNDDKECITVSMEMKKMSLSSNAEYITSMNRIMRSNIDKIYSMQQCRSLLHGYSSDYDKKELVNHQGGDNNGMTVSKLRGILDSEAMKTATDYIRNYVKYFYSPCIEALSEDYGGQKGGISLVKSWFSIEKCQDVTCTVAGATISEDGKCSTEDMDMTTLLIEQYCMPQLP